MSRKQSVRLADNDVVVVGPLERWQHLIMLYETMAEEFPEDSDDWKAAARWIRDWIQKADIKEDDAWL